MRGLLGRAKALADESGEATIEFVTVVLLLLVPLVYFILALFTVQSGMYAAEAGAAASARILTEHPENGKAAAKTAVQLAVADQSLDVQKVSFSLHCDTGKCPQAGSTGTLSVNLRVSLPVVGTLLEGFLPAEIPLQAKHPIKWGEHGA